jgi:signal transduction histidine kinase
MDLSRVNAMPGIAPASSRIADRWPWVGMMVVALGYVLAAKVGFSLAFATRQVTAIWPPTGIALAALLLVGRRVWPGVFLGAFIANLLQGTPPMAAIGIAIGNTLGPLCGLWLLQRVAGFDSALERTRDVIAMAVFGSILAMTVTATNGVFNLVLAGVVPWSAYASVWWVWWAGDAMGALLVAPLLLTWLRPGVWRWRGAGAVELVALIVALVVVGEFSFSGRVPLAYPVFPVVIWAAMRFSQRETAAAVVYIAAMAIWATIHDSGPFSSGTLDQRLILLVTFMATVSVSGLLLGAETAERRVAEASLQSAHRELEGRVAERTAELAAANHQLIAANEALSQRTAQLASKNEEVEAFVYIVSHDLRAPLVNLQGFAKELELGCGELEQLLAGAELNPSVAASIRQVLDDSIHGSLRYIGASADKFERLIGALLMLSRTGQQSYRMEPVNVRAVVETTLDSLQQSVETAAAVVEVGPLPRATGDITAIGQIFSNLLGNALKYLQPGRAGHIEVGGDRLDGMVQYWVRDNGAGIPQSAQRRLFQVFQRFHPELAAGEGIGLAAVKRIVERHGGRIRAESEPGVGTTFYFTLPAA